MWESIKWKFGQLKVMINYIKKIQISNCSSYSVDYSRDITIKQRKYLEQVRLFLLSKHKSKLKRRGIAMCQRVDRILMEKEISLTSRCHGKFSEEKLTSSEDLVLQ